MGLFNGISKGWGDLWDSINGNHAKRAQEEAMRTAQSNNAAALTAEQTAQQQALDFQKILAYFQLQQANQQNQQSNTLMGQQLAGTLAGQQQAANQFAQLYNQDMVNNLPQMQARLAAMQALGPLMQMSGLQAYQMPTSLDTTKLTAPDIIGQFDTLSSKYASQYNPASLQRAQAQQGEQFLQAMSDPAAWLASQGTQTPGTTGTTLPSNIRASAPAGSIRVPPATTAATNAAAMQAAAVGAPAAAGAATPVYNPATTQPTMTALQPVTGPLQGSQLETDPVYQFRLQQAQRELANQLSRRGLGTGGVATQANTNLALGMARDESNEKYNRLMNLVNMGMGGGMTQAGTNAGQQLGSMYQQGASATGNALSNIANAQNTAASNRSGIYSGLAGAYGQNAAARGQSLANYYGANSAAAQQYGNWQAQQPSGLSRVIDLGTKIYGASQGFNSGSQSSPFGYFGAKGSWSNPYSDYDLANTPAFG
jgi:hypothetical protein